MARRALGATGCLGAIVILFAVIGVLALVAELQSPTVVLWTGEHINAVERGGLVLYSFQGRNYTLVDPDQPASEPQRTITVFVNPNDATNAMLDRGATRWFDASFVLAPFTAALVFLVVAVLRRRRGRVAAADGGFGTGFDPSVLGSRRRDGPNPPER